MAEAFWLNLERIVKQPVNTNNDQKQNESITEPEQMTPEELNKFISVFMRKKELIFRNIYSFFYV